MVLGHVSLCAVHRSSVIIVSAMLLINSPVIWMKSGPLTEI